MTNDGRVMRPVFWTQSIKAFVIQLALMVIATAVAFVPFIGMVAAFFLVLMTFLYLPTMALVKAMNLFPTSDGLLDYLAGWLLGVLIYSLAWGALKTLVARKRRGDSNDASNKRLQPTPR